MLVNDLDLRLTRGPLKLSPSARATPWDGAIQTVPIDAIGPFLTRPYVMEEGQLEKAPYIVAFGDEHIVGGAGQRAYVRSIDDSGQLKHEILRPGGPYRDAETGEILGYEALYIGTSQLQRTGDPATIFINSTKLEAITGDRVIPAGEEKATANFTPHAPPMPIEGSIISVLGGISQIGQYSIVVIDRGMKDGLDPGTVLRIDNGGQVIRDVVTPNSRDTVRLPEEQAGLLMVFRSFERVSFGLVMYATDVMNVFDKVRNP